MVFSKLCYKDCPQGTYITGETENGHGDQSLDM